MHMCQMLVHFLLIYHSHASVYLPFLVASLFRSSFSSSTSVMLVGSMIKFLFKFLNRNFETQKWLPADKARTHIHSKAGNPQKCEWCSKLSLSIFLYNFHYFKLYECVNILVGWGKWRNYVYRHEFFIVQLSQGCRFWNVSCSKSSSLETPS